jgi:hypothetical protein
MSLLQIQGVPAGPVTIHPLIYLLGLFLLSQYITPHNISETVCGVMCCDNGKKILINITEKTYMKTLSKQLYDL